MRAPANTISCARILDVPISRGETGHFDELVSTVWIPDLGHGHCVCDRPGVFVDFRPVARWPVNFRSIGALTTIVVSFVEAACGSSISAVVFWVSLFAAAAARRTEDDEPAEGDGRWM
jgi:hypothetical protein